MPKSIKTSQPSVDPIVLRACIERRYNDLNQPSENSRAAYNAINMLINQVLSGDVYINELVQNADDAYADTISMNIVSIPANSSSVESAGFKGESSPSFQASASAELHGSSSADTCEQDVSFLIFQHNGNSFTPGDIEGLCQIASDKRTKASDIDSVGEKGIGFKSLFSISDQVFIISDGIAFKFDKCHHAWAADPTSVAWPIIPILTELSELPESIRIKCNLDDANNISFIIKLNDTSPNLYQEIDESISRWVESQRTVIFLKNILTIHSSHTKLTKTQTKKMGQFLQLTTHLESSSRTEKKHWLLHKTISFLSDQDISVISRLSSLPVKYQTLETINIDLAYEYDETKNSVVALEPETGHTIFVTLPTEIRDLNLPFLVNTKLVLSANRKAFGEHKDCTKWNTIILKYVYLAQLSAIRSLIRCSSNHNASLIAVLALPPTNSTRNIRWEKIEAVFYPELDNTPMLLAEDKSTILTPSVARFDKTKFITYLSPYMIKSVFVSSAVRKQKKLYSLSRYQSQTLDFNGIACIIRSDEFQSIISSPENNRLLFDFLLEYHELVDPKYGLNKLKMILASDNTLKTPDEVFIPDETFKLLFIEQSSALGIPLIHPVINKIRYFELLNTLGVQLLSFSKIIEYANKTRENAIQLMQKLNLSQLSEPLTQSIIDEVNRSMKFAVVGRSEITNENLYLPDAMDPIDCIEKYFPASIIGFIDILAYCPNKRYLNEWHELFSKLSVVSSSLTLPSLERYIQLSKDLEPRALIDFTKLIFEHYYLPSLQPDAEKWRTDWSRLSIVTVSGEIITATQTYLADDYGPTVPLQQSIDSLHYLSSDYIADIDDVNMIASWRKFFLTLGVSESITTVYRTAPITLHDLSAKGKLASKYVDMLLNEKIRRHFHADQSVFPDISAKKKQSKILKKHTITGFYDVQHIEQLYQSPLFLKMLSQLPLTPRVSYKAESSTRNDVVNNLQFYAGQKVYDFTRNYPSELYAPSITNVFEGLWNSRKLVGHIAAEFSAEFQEHCGFKQTISASHLKEIFEGLMKHVPAAFSDDAENISTDIRKIYCAYLEQVVKSYRLNPMAFYGDSVSESIVSFYENTYLLNRAGTFKKTSLLFVTQDELLETPNSRHALAWFPPEIKSNIENYTALIEFFGLKQLEMQDFQATEFIESEVNVRLKEDLRNKLAFILYQTAWNEDEIDVFSDNYRLRAKKVIDNFNALKIIACTKLVIAYKKLSLPTRVWYNTERHVLYHNARCAHGEGLQDIAKAITKILNISIEPKVMSGILLNSAEDLFAEFSEYGMTTQIFEYLNQLRGGAFTSLPIENTLSNIEIKPVFRIPIHAVDSLVSITPKPPSESSFKDALSSENERRLSVDEVNLNSDFQDHTPALSLELQQKKRDTYFSHRNVRHPKIYTEASNLVPTSAATITEHYHSPLGLSADTFPRKKNEQESMLRFGRNAEQCVFEHVIAEFKNKYSAKKIRTENKYSISVSYKGYRESVRWKNSYSESGAPYDFVRTIEIKGVKSRELIEVKAVTENSTTSHPEVHISHYQMEKMRRPCSPPPERDDGAGPASMSCMHGHPLDNGGCTYSLWIAVMTQVEDEASYMKYRLKEIQEIQNFDPAKAEEDSRLRIELKPEYWYRLG